MRINFRLRFFLIRWIHPDHRAACILRRFKVGTSSSYINVIINWLAIAGYELLVLLFSRLSPKWLTTLSAVILIAPIFASTVLLPLTRIFEPGTIPRVPIGNHLYYKVAPWSVDGAANSGVDLDILYSPPFAPFLSHKVQSQPFNTQACNAFASFALLGPTPRTSSLLPTLASEPPESKKALQLSNSSDPVKGYRQRDANSSSPNRSRVIPSARQRATSTRSQANFSSSPAPSLRSCPGQRFPTKAKSSPSSLSSGSASSVTSKPSHAADAKQFPRFGLFSS
jgi:hypothetical protein